MKTVAPHVAVTVDYGGHLLLSPLLRTTARWAPKLQVQYTPKRIRTTGTKLMMGRPIYFGAVTTMHWSDEHESITVRSDEAAVHSLLMSVV